MAAIPRALLLLLPLAGLAACDQTAEDAAPATKRAEGEVLGGTISDDMIALDRLRSQSPPLRVAPTEGGDAAASGEETGDEGAGVATPSEPSAGPEAAPAETE